MNAVPFDTLKLARDLEAAGLTPPVAAGAASALADALIGADLVTKADLLGSIGSLEARMSARFDLIETKFESKIELLRRDMTIRLGSMLIVAVGVILTAMRLMPHP